MKLYADTPVRRTRQLLSDVLTLLWVGAWVWLGRQTHDVVMGLKAQGATHIIEFGPGKVLSGLVSRIDKSLKVGAVFDPASLESTLKELA